MDMGSNDFRGFDATDFEAALRPLGWSELCARLVAAQDFRRSLDLGPIGRHALPSNTWPDTAPGSSPGSFHTGTARMLEHFDTGNRGVNSNSSTYGKDNQGTPDDTRQTSLSAFAERQADENRHD